MDRPTTTGARNGTETPSSRLLRAYREEGDRAARQRLIELHMPLVRPLVCCFVGRGGKQEAAVAAGAIGLVEAIDDFDPERGGELIRFAVPRIVAEIKGHLPDEGALLRLDGRIPGLRALIAHAQLDLSARLGEAPSTAELARALAVDEWEVEWALAAREAEPTQVPPEVEGPANDELAGSLFQLLDERDRRIVELRFVRGLSCTRVGRKLGISPSHVSRRTQAAFASLRAELERDVGEEGAAWDAGRSPRGRFRRDRGGQTGGRVSPVGAAPEVEERPTTTGRPGAPMAPASGGGVWTRSRRLRVAPRRLAGVVARRAGRS